MSPRAPKPVSLTGVLTTATHTHTAGPLPYFLDPQSCLTRSWIGSTLHCSTFQHRCRPEKGFSPALSRMPNSIMRAFEGYSSSGRLHLPPQASGTF